MLKALSKLQTLLKVDNEKGKANQIEYIPFIFANNGLLYKSGFDNRVKCITDSNSMMVLT